MQTWLFAAVLIAAGLWAIAQFNMLVRLRHEIRNAFAQIDVQLKRRHDLIPNLLEIAKGALAHERQTLEAVTQARSEAMQARERAHQAPGDAETMDRLMRAEDQLGSALGRFLAVAEAYPELQANQNMLALSEELTSTENRVGFARQAHNDAVMSYNVKTQQFPASLIATWFGFRPEKELQFTQSRAERQPVRVSF
jgi:LemA protein